MKERLQKILAHCGVASRRHAEEMIVQGRVSVNGRRVTELGSRFDPVEDVIFVDGRRVQGAQELLYVLLHKPKGVMSTTSDPEGRPTVMDYVRKDVPERLYPVGRLDYGSEGLIILSNDGEFTRQMTRAGVVPKVYHVKLSRRPAAEDLQRLARGIRLEDGKLAPCEIRLLRTGENPWYEVTLHQGRNQQIRRMFQAVGHPVEKLRRVRIGFLEDSRLRPGRWRLLTSAEVERFRREYFKGPSGRKGPR